MPNSSARDDGIGKAIEKCRENIAAEYLKIRWMCIPLFIASGVCVGLFAASPFIFGRFAEFEKLGYFFIGAFAIIFGAAIAIYRFHQVEIAKNEQMEMGFLRIRVAAYNGAPGFQTEVRRSLTLNAFATEKPEKNEKSESLPTDIASGIIRHLDAGATGSATSFISDVAWRVHPTKRAIREPSDRTVEAEVRVGTNISKAFWPVVLGGIQPYLVFGRSEKNERLVIYLDPALIRDAVFADTVYSDILDAAKATVLLEPVAPAEVH